MPTYGFSEEDAKRIGRSVRLTERYVGKDDLTGASSERGGIGVRLLLARHVGTSWPTQTTAVVTIYNGDPITSAATVVAKNQYLKFSTNANCTQNWVALGHNGWGWYAISKEFSCTATCSSSFGGLDFSAVPGYAATATQVLGHEAGCVRWLDVTTCSTSTAA